MLPCATLVFPTTPNVCLVRLAAHRERFAQGERMAALEAIQQEQSALLFAGHGPLDAVNHKGGREAERAAKRKLVEEAEAALRQAQDAVSPSAFSRLPLSACADSAPPQPPISGAKSGSGVHPTCLTQLSTACLSHTIAAGRGTRA